jgi:hypothetical protein
VRERNSLLGSGDVFDHESFKRNCNISKLIHRDMNYFSIENLSILEENPSAKTTKILLQYYNMGIQFVLL